MFRCSATPSTIRAAVGVGVVAIATVMMGVILVSDGRSDGRDGGRAAGPVPGARGTQADRDGAQAPQDVRGRPGASAQPHPGPASSSGGASHLALPPRPTVTVPAHGTYSWSLYDRVAGTTSGSPNATETNFTESMVKVWLAGDHLARAAARDRQPSAFRLGQLSTMIRDSDDGAAQAIWRAGGGDSVIARMITSCGLRDTKVHPGWWSKTLMSARDATRLGTCLANGIPAGPEWTDWILAEMRQVRGEGDFGIVEAVPAHVAGSLAVKNGWTRHGFDNHWRVNCLAIHDDWVLAIMTRYPAQLGLAHGASACAGIARQALAPLL